MTQDRQHLELARRHLAEGATRIARQRALIAKLHAAGQPTELARELLGSMTETLRQMQAHRDLLAGGRDEG